jgi:hypothetical protein
MIAFTYQPETGQIASWHKGFLTMLPTLERYACFAFRHLLAEARDNAVREVIANCLCAYHRIYERNELRRAFALALVRFAVAQYHAGRRVGTAWNSRDVYSAQAQQEADIEIHPLETPGEQSDQWQESLTDNHQTPVPDQVHFRIEFPRWLDAQTNRNRQIAETLAFGYSTGEVARKFNLSAARISQIRRELYASWNEFTGESQAAPECQRPRELNAALRQFQAGTAKTPAVAAKSCRGTTIRKQG